MERSWLVQRLEKPRTGVNPFSFGGGYKNGGLSDEAMEMLSGVFSFVYMGAAEFEFGAVPKALSGLHKDRKALIADSQQIDISKVKPNWNEQGKEFTGNATLYLIARRSQADEAWDRITTWAVQAEDLKEPTQIARTLRPVTEWDGETVGWLELNNGFFFFTDEQMWRDTAALFGVKIP